MSLYDNACKKEKNKLLKMKILFVRLDHIGDCFLTLPSIEEYRKNFPHNEIHVLCKKNTREIFEKCGLIHKIHTVNFPHTCNKYEKKSSFLEIINTIFNLRKEKFDKVYNFRPNKKDTFFLKLISRNLLQPAEMLYKDNIHIIVRNKINLSQAFDYISYREKNYSKLTVKNTDKIKIPENIKHKILFYTGATEWKKFDREKMLLLWELLKKSELEFLAVSGKYDEQTGFEDFVIQSIDEWVTICENSRGVISFDSGPMHIAAAHAEKIITIFGPTSPEYFGPVSENSEVVELDKTNKHIPGMKLTEKHKKCFENVKIEDLVSHIFDFFNKTV